MDVTFSLAWDSDFEALVDVQNQSLPSDFEKQATIDTPEEMADLLRQRKAYIYAIRAGDEIIGDLVVREKASGDFALGCLCVVPEHQGKGVGRKAIDFLEGAFPDASHWSLATSAGNDRSIQFWEKNGFKETGKTIEHGAEIVTMEWSAPSQS